MTLPVSRLRMFAGPNGSGKSTFNRILSPSLLGRYINADEIEKQVVAKGCYDIMANGVDASRADALKFFDQHPLKAKAGLGEAATWLEFQDGKLSFRGVEMNSYIAAVTADYLRHKLLEQGVSFTFETVMSSRDKVTFLQKAQSRGYRTYLYFVATEDPEINISRVRTRVELGGHPVPEDKIVSRYARSLDLLMDAIRHTSRAYIFDNSGPGPDHVWLAEITDGRALEMKTDQMPTWFKRAVWDKFGSRAA